MKYSILILCIATAKLSVAQHQSPKIDSTKIPGKTYLVQKGKVLYEIELINKDLYMAISKKSNHLLLIQANNERFINKEAQKKLDSLRLKSYGRSDNSLNNGRISSAFIKRTCGSM